MELIAFLSTGKGTWGHVNRLIQDGEWEKVILLTNDFGKENYKNEQKAELIVLDARRSMLDLIQELKTALQDKIKGPEVGINLISGSGKEHMALIAALIQMGMSFRLVALTTEGIKTL